MKILFSPSEAKYRGGISVKIEKDNYIFPELFDKRLEIITLYRDFIFKASNEELIKLFGTKKQSVIDYYINDIFTRDTMKVIERYDGVAYDYLDYSSLDSLAKKYIDRNVIIFSNLFGCLLAGDIGLPDYKLKQGSKIGTIAVEKLYKEYFSKALDSLLCENHYLDLRASFYNKFYTPSSSYTTLKFIKNGKVVTHWTKAYRGLVLRNLAISNIETIEDFIKMDIEGVVFKDIVNRGIHQEIIYDILN